MTPEEILNQEFNEILRSIPENHKPIKAQYISLGEISKNPNYEAEPVGEVKTYYYTGWKTKYYRDKGCATFKLIKFLKRLIDENKPDIVFWRCDPEVYEDNGFMERWPKFYGRVRLAF